MNNQFQFYNFETAYDYLMTEKGLLNQLQKELIESVGQYEISKDIFENKIILEQLLSSGGCQISAGNKKPELNNQIRWQNALKIFQQLYEEHPGLSGQSLKLLVAVSLTFSSPVQGDHNWESKNQIDHKSRFKYFLNHLEQLNTLSAWEMRFIVGSWASNEELEWARQYSFDNNKTKPQQVVDAPFNDVVPYQKYEGGLPKTLKKMLQGGVCGTISRFGAAFCQAFCIPATCIGQPGHCAYIVKLNDEWCIKNDVSGWAQSTVHDHNQQPTWTQRIMEIPFFDKCQKEFSAYSLSERLRNIAKQVSLVNRAEFLQKVRKICLNNLATWYDLLDCLKEQEKAGIQIDDQVWVQSQKQKLQENSKIAKIVSMKKQVLVSECEERKQNLTDGTDSEWWCEQEQAWFEVDLENDFQIDQINIKWWGTSVAGFYQIKSSLDRTNWINQKIDIIKDGSVYNSFHYIKGWKDLTRYLRVEMQNGKMDHWNMKKMFGIRRFDVHGIQSQLSESQSYTNRQLLESMIEEDLLDQSQWKQGVVKLLISIQDQK